MSHREPLDPSSAAAEGADLVGGRTTGARLVGDTIRKPCSASTPAVHAVLSYLAERGVEGVPRPCGVDDQDRQVLTFLPGDTVGDRLPWPDWVWSPALIDDVGRWLRRLHDQTAGFVPPPDAVWFSGHPWRPGLIIGHHDAAPWNAVVRQGRLVGFIDWDTAGPSSRERDLALTALTWVPLVPPEFAAILGFTATEQRARRLQLLLDAYGYTGDRALFAGHVADRARLQATLIRLLADHDDPVYTAMLPMAATMDAAARHVETLPRGFWTTDHRVCATADPDLFDP